MDEELEKFWRSGSYWGDLKMIPFISYQRKSNMKCIYCGAAADTREHCPSKTFLEPPLPTNLIVLPACNRCNNGFSSDELYVKTLLNVIRKKRAGVETLDEFDRPEERDAVVSADRLLKMEGQIRDPKVERILLKLAIGHAAYELSELLLDDWNGCLETIDYVWRPQIDETDWDSLSAPVNIKDGVLPEVGARSYRNIYVAVDGDGKSMLVDWNEVQPGSYKYITYYDDEKLIVKMIIKDLLYSQVVFSKSVTFGIQ